MLAKILPYDAIYLSILNEREREREREREGGRERERKGGRERAAALSSSIYSVLSFKFVCLNERDDSVLMIHMPRF